MGISIEHVSSPLMHLELTECLNPYGNAIEISTLVEFLGSSPILVLLCLALAVAEYIAWLISSACLSFEQFILARLAFAASVIVALSLSESSSASFVSESSLPLPVKTFKECTVFLI